jgi:hypothetical protein
MLKLDYGGDGSSSGNSEDELHRSRIPWNALSQQMRSRESIHGVLVKSCSLSEAETNLHRKAAIPVWEGITDTQGRQWRDGLAVGFFQSFVADPMRPVPAGRGMILHNLAFKALYRRPLMQYDVKRAGLNLRIIDRDSPDI